MSGDWLALGAIAALAAVATGRRGSANERAWLPLDLVSAIEPEMARQGVSKVARSKRGFLTAFKRAGGKPDKLGLTHPDTPNRDPYPWRDRRNEFVSRHMGQVKANNEPLWRDGRPTRRHLGLVAWAYSPNPTKLREWIKGSLSRRGSHSAVAKRSVYTQDDGWKTEPALGVARQQRSRGAKNVGQPDWIRIRNALDRVQSLRARWIHGPAPAWNSQDQEEEDGDDFFLAQWSEMPKHLQKWWQNETGMTYIGMGANRVVFRMNDGNIIKLALDYDGERANLSEIEVWDELSETIAAADFLVPLLGGDERFIVMEQADPLRLPLAQPMLNRLNTRILAWKALGTDVDDTHPSNWGIHENKLRLLDYQADT